MLQRIENLIYSHHLNFQMVMDQCRNGFLSFKITNMIPLLLIVLLRLGIVPNEVHHRLYHAHF